MPKDAKGKFCNKDGEQFGTYVDEKGYPRISAGPHRGVRVHTLVAEAMLGRKLEKHEDVNHIDQNKLDCAWTNLEVLDHRKHGWVSSQQAQFMRRKEEDAKKEWEAEFGEESTQPVEFDELFDPFNHPLSQL